MLHNFDYLCHNYDLPKHDIMWQKWASLKITYRITKHKWHTTNKFKKKGHKICNLLQLIRVIHKSPFSVFIFLYR